MDQVDVVDAGDEEQVTKKKRVSKSKRDREIDELRSILGTYGGRAFLWRLLTQCGVFQTSFTGDNHTFFKEGKRDIGLYVLREIFDTDTGAFQKMQHEATDRGEKK